MENNRILYLLSWHTILRVYIRQSKMIRDEYPKNSSEDAFFRDNLALEKFMNLLSLLFTLKQALLIKFMLKKQLLNNVSL